MQYLNPVKDWLDRLDAKATESSVRQFARSCWVKHGSALTRYLLPVLVVALPVFLLDKLVSWLLTGMASNVGALPIATMTLVAVLILRMIQDFVYSVQLRGAGQLRGQDNTGDRDNNTLEVGLSVSEIDSRVARRCAEIEKEWAHKQQQENDRILDEERSRIMMEMHDGIGSQLVSIISQIDNRSVEACEVKEGIQDALDDLRLMVDSVNPVDNDILMALGAFRHRLEKTLAGSDMSLSWKVVDVDPVQNLGPSEVLHTLRILQECATNAIRHSGGDCLTLRTGQDANGVFVSLSDNGCGYDRDCRKGQGLANMQRRAENAGLALTVDSSEQGVTVTIGLDQPCNTAQMPLARAA